MGEGLSPTNRNVTGIEKKWMQTLIFGKFKNFVSSGSEKPSQKRGCLSWILKPDGKVVQFKACIIINRT